MTDLAVLSPSTIEPAAYGRTPLTDFAAVTVFDGSSYHTINRPQAAYFGSTGRMTIQRSKMSGPDKTFTTTDPNAYIVSVLSGGHAFDTTDEGRHNDLRMLRAMLHRIFAEK